MKGKKTGGRQKGTPNKATAEVKEFARQCLEDPAYQKALKVRLKEGEAPQIEALLYHYAYGKPRETIQHEGNIPPFMMLVHEDDGTDPAEFDDGGDDTVQ